MEQAQIESLLSEVREVLKGVDEKGCSSSDGWWETSAGAAFGAERLAALEALLRERLVATSPSSTCVR